MTIHQSLNLLAVFTTFIKPYTAPDSIYTLCLKTDLKTILSSTTKHFKWPFLWSFSTDIVYTFFFISYQELFTPHFIFKV